MNAFLARLREPSTAAGLAVLASLFGADVAQSQAIATTVATVAAAAAILLPEKAAK